MLISQRFLPLSVPNRHLRGTLGSKGFFGATVPIVETIVGIGTARFYHACLLPRGARPRHRSAAAATQKERPLSLGLKPTDYLEMLKEEYAEYKADPVSMRKAINCCAHSNALPEIIFAK